MTQPSFNLVSLMNQFYQQIATIKRWIAHDQLMLEAKAILKLHAMPNNAEVASAVSLLLSQWLGQKRLYWRDRLTERQLMLLDQACFAMSALADELFILELEWVGKEHWHEVLLEQHFYQSCSAGGTFYREVDTLLAQNKYAPLEVQLAAVYLMVLRLGFSGQYRDNHLKLTEYRNKLFKIVIQHQPVSVKLIHSQAYEHCFVSRQEQRLAPIANWYRGVVYGVCGYLAVGIVAWVLLNEGMDKWILS